MRLILVTDVYHGGIRAYIKNLIAYLLKILRSESPNLFLYIILVGSNEEYLILKNEFCENSNLKIYFIKTIHDGYKAYIEQFIKLIKFFIFNKKFFLKKERTLFVFNTIKPSLPFLLLKPFFFNDSKIHSYFQFHGFADIERYTEERFNYLYEKKNNFFITIFILFKYLLRKIISKAIFLNVDKVITFSQYTKRYVYKYYRIPFKKIYCIKPGLDVKLKKNRKNKEDLPIFFNKNFLKIGIFQRLEPRKNILEFLNIFKNLCKVKKNLFLIICAPILLSNNNYFLYLLKKIRELDLTENVLIINDPKRIDLYYRNVDLMVVPSQRLETLSFVGLESLINGVPVIAINNSGAKDYIKSGYNGFLFKNYKELYWILLRIIKNKKIIIKLKKNVKSDIKKIQSEYHWNKYVNFLTSKI